MDNKPMFNKTKKDSDFLAFVAQEFFAKGSEHRTQLSSKEYASKLVSQLGLRVPHQHRLIHRIEDLGARDLERRVVLKYALGWSARGVMLLEPLEKDRYFDHMTLKVHSLRSIKQYQKEVVDSFGHTHPCWILEEFLEPVQAVGAVPFDYKFYMFGVQTGVIVQFDRNSSPPRVAMFDGMFCPLIQGQDFVLTNTKNQPGVPLVPPHAAELQWWAIKLAKQTDAPFVRVDLYDTPSGPAFGEYTFSPGATHKGTFKFSDTLVDYLDTLYLASEQHLSKLWEGLGAYPENALTKYNQMLAKSSLSDISGTSPALDLYKIWSHVAYNQGHRGALRLRDHYHGVAEHKKHSTASKIAGQLALNWEIIHDRLKKSITERIDSEYGQR